MGKGDERKWSSSSFRTCMVASLCLESLTLSSVVL